MNKATIEIPENARNLKDLIDHIEKELTKKKIDYSKIYCCDGQSIKVRYNGFAYYPGQICLL